MNWTALPEAQRLLASCAANPPPRATWRGRDGQMKHDHYTGPDVRKLTAIYNAEAERILAECDASRDYSAFDAHCRISVQAALDAAIQERPQMEDAA